MWGVVLPCRLQVLEVGWCTVRPQQHRRHQDPLWSGARPLIRVRLQPQRTLVATPIDCVDRSLETVTVNTAQVLWRIHESVIYKQYTSRAYVTSTTQSELRSNETSHNRYRLTRTAADWTTWCMLWSQCMHSRRLIQQYCSVYNPLYYFTKV